MVRVLGYQIDVASWPGKGSRFTLTLPVATVPSLQAWARPILPESHDRGFGGACVLVIDNEPAVAESMQALLERWGCRVLTAASREHALAVIGQTSQQPDVILADYHLDNDLTGFDAIHRVRKAVGRDIPAAIITADRSDETRALLRAQYLPVLNKPVKPNRLRALLTSLVGVVGSV
jgi:CheY-like chemotaxis protein